MEYYAIIVAGGSGNRMKTEIPKQFLLLNQLPVLMHTINAFAQSSSNPEILVALSLDLHQYWAELCEKYHFKTAHKIIPGGRERFHSVKNALDYINGDGLVAVHDGVRPMVSSKLIDSCYADAKKFGNAIPAVVASESVRQKTTHSPSFALARNEIYLIQTPQTFKVTALKEAYLQEFKQSFTDDASVVEESGSVIFLTEGERTNIKITYPQDLDFAGLLIKKRSTFTK